MRRKLKHDISKLKMFNERNDYIDKKIEYDQRFYNDGYAEFQLMISDIRKQIRLNDEIMKLRKQLNHVYDKICKKDHSKKEERILNQYNAKRQKLDEIKDIANKNSVKLIETLERKQTIHDEFNLIKKDVLKGTISKIVV